MGILQDAPPHAREFGLQPRAPRHEPDLSQPDVSVCIVNWNCVELLRKCLASIFAQSQGIRFEVIVVDNASTDAAADMVAEEFPAVHLLRNRENVGFSRGNNQAAKLAKGRYLFFLNNDTEITPNTLAEFVTFADRNPGVGMVGPKLRDARGDYQIAYRTKPTIGALLHRVSILRWTGLFRGAYYRYRRATFQPDGVRAVEVLMGAAVFLPRDVFEESGRWDERYRFGGEDLDLSTQVGRKREVVYFSNVEILHYGRVSSRANVSFSAPNVAVGYVHYFRKAGASRAALIAYKFIVTIDTPVQLSLKALQAAARIVTGRTEKARKSWLTVRGLWHFLTGELVQFWMA